MQKQKNIMFHTDTQSVCDFCKLPNLEVLYRVPQSRKKTVVAICNNCGLVQSIYGNSLPLKRIISATSGAGWGNIRHGKELRFCQINKILKSKIQWKNIQNVLDIGSNRGSFIHWVQENYPFVKITAIEPDSSVTTSYNKISKIQLIKDRFEHTHLPEQNFDLIFCFHTLEHADSAREMVTKIYECLKPNGILFLEVPNLSMIEDPLLTEEFFIDKHSYHFSRDVLINFLVKIGFSIEYESESIKGFNITIIATKFKRNSIKKNNTTESIRQTKNNINKYIKSLSENRIILTKIATKLNMFTQRQKVAFWGAGRIFDALIVYGGLHTENIHCLVDTYLAGKLKTHHGIPILSPDSLKFTSPDVFIILANSSSDEIYQQIRKYGFINIIKFRDLIEEVKY